MTLESDLYGYLTADAGVAAVVGTRVYPLRPTQNPTLPYLTYQLISRRDVHSTDGASGLANTLVQIDAWGATYADVVSAFEAVRKCLNGYRGAIAQGIFLEPIDDEYDNGARVYRRKASFSVWHEESTT